MHKLKSKGIEDETREEKHGGPGVEERLLRFVIQDDVRFIVNTIVGTWNEGSHDPELYWCDELGSDLTRLS
jgi:hypothetical protein